MKRTKRWLSQRGIHPKDLLLVFAAMIPLTLFVALGIYGTVGALFL